MMANDDDYVEIDVEVMQDSQSGLALLCRDGNDREVWIPKSLIRTPEVEDIENALQAYIDGGMGYPSVILTLPEWFAIREELV